MNDSFYSAFNKGSTMNIHFQLLSISIDLNKHVDIRI